MAYYASQVRSLEKQAELERKLVETKLVESRLVQQKTKNALYEDKPALKRSRKKQDEETSIFLKRSRLQSQLEASNVCSNAILNRSRVEAALEARQANNRLRHQLSQSHLQQLLQQEQQRAVEQQLILERERQLELNQIKEARAEAELAEKVENYWVYKEWDARRYAQERELQEKFLMISIDDPVQRYRLLEDRELSSVLVSKYRHLYY